MLLNITFLKTLNVLYIESDPTIAMQLDIVLKKMFNEVSTNQTASQAINTIKENNNFDIVICDLKLSDKKGIDTLKEIREINSEIPFILTTKEANTDDLLEAIKINVDEYLIKPINPKDLVMAVEKICHVKFQEKLQKQTVKNLDDMIAIINEIALVTRTNLDGEIILVNDSFCKATGYENSELIGKSLDIVRDLNSNKNTYEEINNTIYSGKIWEGKLKNYTKDGEEFYVYLNAIPIFDDNNEIKEFIWIRFLITEYEQEHKEFKKNVAKNIHQNRRVNNDAREKIDELMKRLAYYQNLDKAIELEKNRDAKFKSQLSFYEEELKEGEKRLKTISEIANKRIIEVIESEKTTREAKMKIDEQLETLVNQFKDRNKQIQDFTKEIDRQKALIKEIEQKIIVLETGAK